MLVAKDELINKMLMKGWNLSDLSRNATVAYSTVWLMKSKQPVSAKTAQKIADALEVSIDDVFRIHS